VLAPLAVVAALVLLARWFGGEAVAGWSVLLGPAPWDAGTAVVAAAATGGAAVAAWLALGALVSTLTLLRGRHRRPALVPVAVHRATALLLGVSLAAGATAAAAPVAAPTSPAASTAPASTAPQPAAGTPAVAGLDPAWRPPEPAPVPDPGWRPTTAPAAPPRTVAEPIDPVLLTGRHQPPDQQHVITVRRGDTLWDLAARRLGPGASDAEVAVEWPRWYAANREVVGPDPDLLLPGQQLVPPDG